MVTVLKVLAVIALWVAGMVILGVIAERFGFERERHDGS